MKILIVGSGIAGGFIGARLVEKKCDVTFVVTPRRRVQLMTTGLALASHFGRFRRPVVAITPEEVCDIYDVVIIACRANDYEDVFAMLTPSIGPETIVLPVIEGANHLQADLVPNGVRLIGAVLEARVVLDADGVLHQRLPAAELHLAAASAHDIGRVEQVADLLEGRGIKTMLSDRITAAIWERYCFTAAAVAVNVMTGMSLRDAVRPTHVITTFDRLLTKGMVIGRAIGLEPKAEHVLRYRTAFRMETRPVQPPALVTEPGRGGDEAAPALTLITFRCCR